MSEQESSAVQSNEDDKKGCCHSRHHSHCCGRRWWAKLLVVTVIAGGLFAWHHHAHGGQWCGFGPGMNHSSLSNPQRMQARAESMTNHMLGRVNATDAQRQQAALIAHAAVADLQPLLDAHRATRASLYSALSAETVDPAKLEKLRSETLQRADAVSRRLTQEVIELAAVLSPTQRRELLSRWAPELDTKG